MKGGERQVHQCCFFSFISIVFSLTKRAKSASPSEFHVNFSMRLSRLRPHPPPRLLAAPPPPHPVPPPQPRKTAPAPAGTARSRLGDRLTRPSAPSSAPAIPGSSTEGRRSHVALCSVGPFRGARPAAPRCLGVCPPAPAGCPAPQAALTPPPAPLRGLGCAQDLETTACGRRTCSSC